MSNEEFDVEAFVSEGMSEAGISEDVDVQAEQTEDVDKSGNSEPDPKPETKKQKVGIPGVLDVDGDSDDEIDADADNDTEAEQQEHTVKGVPVKEHAKLRARARAAEEELAKLKQEFQELQSSKDTTPTEAVNSGKTEDEDLLSEIDDDDFLTGGQVKKAYSAMEQKIIAKIKAEEAKQREILYEQRVKTSLDEVEKVHPDYAEKMKVITEVSPFTEKEKALITSSDKPAITAYEIAEKKINSMKSLLGLDSAATSENKQQQNNDSEQETFVNDEDAFMAFLS
jgi:hypothetical protein